MPIHDYRCHSCGALHENQVVNWDDEYIPCDCGAEAQRFYQKTGHIHGDEIKPFWCPVSDRTISSRSEWHKVMRENNLECKGNDTPRLADRMGMKEDSEHRKRLGVE